MARLYLTFLIALTVATDVHSGGGIACTFADQNQLAQGVLDSDPAVAESAVAELRRRGPDGLGLLLAVFQDALKADGVDPRLLDAIDAVAAQKDAHASGLFWHTEMTAALDRARAENKPVLSLRLLGRLDTELSCANSRFFRTVLYANQEVADHLREHYVLHWQSVRPVPVLTIDFGDGRVLKRTITGNSLHLVLDNRGRPIDAIPGLYGPVAFLEALDRSEQLLGNLPLEAGSQRMPFCVISMLPDCLPSPVVGKGT